MSQLPENKSQAERESQLKQVKRKSFLVNGGRFSVLELLALSFSSRRLGGLHNQDNFLFWGEGADLEVAMGVWVHRQLRLLLVSFLDDDLETDRVDCR
jgi:hypothetical protein